VRRSAVSCASPWHRGDRFIASRLDAFERRIEFRRLTDQGRQTVVLDRIVCRSRMRAEVEDRRPTGDAGTAQLFGKD
jgi:hypothetical protein